MEPPRIVSYQILASIINMHFMILIKSRFICFYYDIASQQLVNISGLLFVLIPSWQKLKQSYQMNS